MRMIYLFEGVDMRYGHDALKIIAKKKRVDLEKLPPKSAVFFLSNDKHRLKAYSFNGVLSYMRQQEYNRPIDIGAIEEFSKAFDAKGNFDYTKALKVRLEKLLTRKSRKKET